MPPDTVVVIPCYNEARRLDVNAFKEFVRKADVRFLFVDDGSFDETPSVLESIRREAPERCAIHRMERNVGKAEAVRAGVGRALESQPAFVGYWDADLATPLDEIEKFRKLLAEHAGLVGVFGSRVRRLGADIRRNELRHYVGRVFATCASLVLGVPVYDTQCGAKLFRATDEMRAAFATRFMSRWIFDVELLARILQAARRQGVPANGMFLEKPLDRWEDVAGSKLRLADGAAAFIELLRIWRKYR